MKAITENLKFADIFPEKAAEFAQRLHIKKDEIPFVRKYYTAEKDKSEIKKDERAVVSYISTGIKDRDGEKLVPEGAIIENYQKNPIVPFAHDYKSIPPAKNMWIKRDEKGLVAKTVFAKNQRADEIYRAYTDDVGGTGPLLNAWSVGFIPIEWEDTDAKALEKDSSLPKRIYNKWELLEYSAVPIPSCPEALTIAIEKGFISKKLQKELEIEVVKTEIKLTIEDEKEKKDKEIMVEKDEPMGMVTHPVAKITEFSKTISGEYEIEVEKDEEIVITKEELEEEIMKQRNEAITKPETTEKYHHIPVNPGCKITATITISADKGIKATYCGKVKKIHTYLFDVNKFSMEEAQAWVKENHKRELEDSIQKYFTEGIVPEKEEYKEIIASIIDESDKELLEDKETEEEEKSEKEEDEEESDALRDDVSAELDETKDITTEVQQGEEKKTISTEALKSVLEWQDIKEIEKVVNTIKEQNEVIANLHENIIAEKDDIIAELKEGRVLSRKNRDVVKAAISALSAVLKADAAGSQEDTDGEGEGTVTEREVEIVKDGEKEFSKEDIAKVIKETSGPALVAAVEKALKENLNPEKLKGAMKEIARIELQRIRGKVE